MRYIIAPFILIGGVSLGVFLQYFGFGNTPTVGLDLYFPLDLDEIKAYARLGVSISTVGGNLTFETSGWKDPLKTVLISSKSVSISKGLSRRFVPILMDVKPDDWVLKIHGTWVKISNEFYILTDTGYLIYGVGKGWRVHLRPFDFLTLGYSSDHGFELTLSSGGISVGYVGGNLRFYVFEGDLNICVSMGNSIWIGYFSEDNYLAIGEGGVEFVEKVGKVYVSGEVRKGKFEFKLEYPIEF